MDPKQQANLCVAVIAVAVASAILVADLSLPLGVAGGVPYVALVLLGWWFDKPKYIFVLAAVSVTLTVVGYYYSPAGGTYWVVLTNRFLAVFAIAVTAALLTKAKYAEQSSRIAHDELKKQSKAALRASEERFRSVVNNSPAKIHIKDADGRYVLVNRLAEELFGVTDAEARGKTTHEIFPKERADAFAAHDRVILDTGLTMSQEEEWQREDGLHTYLTVKFPILDGAGKITAVGAIGTDITGRKRAEGALQKSQCALQERVDELEETKRTLERQGADLTKLADNLRHANAQAESANKAKSMFLANMSHELRTPLNAVIGFSEIIKQETFGPLGNPKYQDYANDILGAGQHLLELINQLLDLSKIESGADELREEEIEIPEFLETVVKLVAGNAQKDGVALAQEIPGNLPAMRADERKLKQCLINVLSNAIKFTDEGGSVVLKAWCSEGDGYVFRVTDTGVGIALDDIAEVLTPFRQVDSFVARENEGTGLGLPLAKALVEQHGGSLDLQSEPGVGTTITLRFPATRTVALRQIAV